MNIVKLQNELKGVPDDALIGYVQNPTGQVPTYLALSELQRRKEMRNSYQAAKPETTVAESLVNEAQPQPMQQGIAAMAPQQMAAPQPTPMPQDPMAPPQGMAGGGMVSFAEGGETESNYLDSQAPLNLNTGMQSVGSGRQMNPLGEMIYKMASMGSLKPTIGQDKQTQDFFYSPHIQYGTDPQTQQFRKLIETGKMAHGGEVHYADGGIAGLDTGNMYDEQIYAQGGIVAFADGGDISEPTGLSGFLGDISTGQKGLTIPNISTLLPLLIGAEKTGARAGEKIMSKYTGATPNPSFMSTPVQNYPSGDKIPGANIAPPADTTTGAKPAADVTKPTVEQDPFAALKKTLAAGPTEKPKSIQDYAGEYKKALGEDPTVQGAKDRLAKMEARAADREEKSGWMALAKAGLTMAAGKSPRAIQNIAEGATAGVNDYVSAQEKLDTLRDKHFELQAQLDRQARAEQVSATTYGANSKEHAEDRAAREKLEKMTMGNQLAIAQLNYGMQKDNKVVANRDKAIDNAMAKTKAILGDSGADPAEFDKLYNTYLAQELQTLGVTSPGAIPKSQSSGTLQSAKDGVYNYVRNAAK